MYLKSFFQSQKKEISAIQQQQGLEPLQTQVKELKEMIEKILIIVVENRETINKLTKQQDEQRKLLEIIQNQQGNMDTQIQQSHQLIKSLKQEFSEINEQTITLLEMEEIQQKNTQDIYQEQDLHLQQLFQKQPQQKDQQIQSIFQNIQKSSIIKPEPQPVSIFYIKNQIQSDVVIITDFGTKYHRTNCKTLKKTRQEVQKIDAQKKGYEACSICNP